MRRKFGDREICSRCKLEVEWHGRDHGWLDRGASTTCPQQYLNGKPVGGIMPHSVRATRPPTSSSRGAP